MNFLLIFIAAYLIGAIPTGVILTRLTGGKDVRKEGSGNIGATNVYRVAGRTLGVITLLGDTLKGAIPVALVISGNLPLQQIALTAIAAFLGHCFPVYLKFKGGKGVATALGIFLVLSPWSVLGALLVFVAVLWKWRFISLASISAAAIIPFLVLVVERSTPLFLVTLAIAALVIFRHRSNIERLIDGTENRFRA